MLAAAVAAAAKGASVASGGAVPEAAAAVVGGVVLSALWGTPGRATAGLQLSSQHLLRLGIVLLGARLSLPAVASIGVNAIFILAVTISTTALLVFGASKFLRISPTLAILVGAGTAICGNTAIITVAPIVRAPEREVSYAVLAVTLLGTLAVIAYPVIGLALGLPQATFGVWAGAAVHDTSQVVATASAYGAEALAVAIVVKLIRNALIAPLVLALALQSRASITPSDLGRAVPLFVLGFVALAGLRSLGALSGQVVDASEALSGAFILLALAAVGLSTQVRALKDLGTRPLLLASVVAGTVAVVALLLSAQISSWATKSI